MIVDIGKACYRSLVRFFEDDERTTEITWYFVPKTRPVLPFPTVFGSQQWEGEGMHTWRAVGVTGLGEQVPTLGYYPWYNGRDVWGAPALRPCGAREEWAEGDLGGPLPPPTGLVPGCCWLPDSIVHRVTADVPLTLALGGANRKQVVSVGSPAVALLAKPETQRIHAVSGSAVLSLDADGLRNLGISRVGLVVIDLVATGTRNLGQVSSGTAVLTLKAQMDPENLGGQEVTPGCLQATHTPQTVHVTISGCTNGSATDCNNANGVWTLTYQGGCNWSGGGPIINGTARTINFGNAGGNTWNLGFQGVAGFYTKTLPGTWDGRSPISMAVGMALGFCNWPATITVAPNTR